MSEKHEHKREIFLSTPIWLIGFAFTVGIIFSTPLPTHTGWDYLAAIVAAYFAWPLILGIAVGKMGL